MTKPLFPVIFILWLCTVFTYLSAQNNYPVGARSAAMGHASTTLSDIWSSYNNQAGLGWLTGIQAGLFFENRFIAAEMSRFGVAVAVPVKKAGTFGVNFSRFGYSQYNENKIGLNYSRAFGKIFSLGIQFNLHYIQLGDIYGNRVTGTGEISFQVKPLPKWIIAAHVYNPTRTPLADFNREKIPTILRVGTSYRFHEKVLASMEVEADIGYAPTFRAGVEYHAIEQLYIRAGINTQPISPTFGVGVKIKNFYLDAGALWQPMIGFSPQLSLHYDFTGTGKKKDKMPQP